MLFQLEDGKSGSKARKPSKQNISSPATPLPPNIDPSLRLDSSDPESEEDILDCIIVASS
jgi:hypothetical protein